MVWFSQAVRKVVKLNLDMTFSLKTKSREKMLHVFKKFLFLLK